MSRVAKKERPQRLLELLRQRARTEAELAAELGCSAKTVKRDLSSLETEGFNFLKQDKHIVLQAEGLMQKAEEPAIDVARATRLMHITLEVQNQPGIPRELLRNRLKGIHMVERHGGRELGEREAKLVEDAFNKTFERDMMFLRESGYIDDRAGGTHPGEKMLPLLPLTGEEVAHLHGVIWENSALSPYMVSLSSVMGKFLAVSPHKGQVASNPLLLKRFERIAVHGRSFSQDAGLVRWRETLDYAIEQRHKLKALCGPSGGKALLQEICPLGLCYNRYNDSWYVYVLPLTDKGHPQTLRLDHIQGLELDDDGGFECPPGFDIEDCVAPSWGISMSEKARVKVRFANVFNVVDKVQQQLTCRPHARFTQEGDFWVMEDTVSGLGEFRSWLRQFGYAAEVLEPPHMRQEFKTTATKLLERYGIDPGQFVEGGQDQ